MKKQIFLKCKKNIRTLSFCYSLNLKLGCIKILKTKYKKRSFGEVKKKTQDFFSHLQTQIKLSNSFKSFYSVIVYTNVHVHTL